MKPKNGTIVSRYGVEFRYQDGTWYPTKDKGWTANEKIAEELMQKWAAGDYKIWDNKANGYVKGDAPITGGLTGSAQGAAITFDYEAQMLDRLGWLKEQQKWFGVKTTPKATENKIPEAEKVIEEKAVAGTGLTGGSAKTALAKTDKAVREAQTEAGVTPLKGNLTSPDNATPLAKASMADYFDMDAALAYNKMTPVKEGLNMDKLSSFSEYLPDVFKGALGLYGASQKLPEFETPQYFTDYERKLKELSTQGLTAEEMATAKRDLERTYAYDVNNIERFAGGRSGVALANLGRATNTYQGNTNALNVADAQMQRQNLAQYGGVVGTHLGLDQNAFNQKYQEAAQSKLAGAQLAADAFSNIQSRSDYNKAYGKGSVYDKYQTSLLQGQEYLNDIYKYQMENPVPLPEYNPIIAPPTIPQYQNQYTNPNG